MKLAALVVILTGATACATAPAPPPPAAPAPPPATASAGAAMAQGKDDPTRKLTEGECDTLGEWVADACREGHSRSAQVDGWCSDVVSRVHAGSWNTECTKEIHYQDLVCFLGSSNPRLMMSCSSAIDG